MSADYHILHTHPIAKNKPALIVAVDPTPDMIRVQNPKYPDLETSDSMVIKMYDRLAREAQRGITSRFGKIVFVYVSTLTGAREAAKDHDTDHILLATKYSMYIDFLVMNLEALPIKNAYRVDKMDLRSWRANPITIGDFTYYKTLPWRQVMLSTQSPQMINAAGLLVEDLSRVLCPVPELPLIDMKDRSWRTTISTMAEWKDFAIKLSQQKDSRISYDLETDNLERVHGNRILTAQFSWDGKHTYILPIDHKDSPFTEEQRESIKRVLKAWMERGKSRYLVGQNITFDLHVTRQCTGAIYVGHKIYDLMASRYLLDENSAEASKGANALAPGVYSLGGNALQFGSFAYLDSPVGKGDRARINALPLDNVAIYGGIDGIIPWHLADIYNELGRRQGFPDFESTVLDLAGASMLAFTEMEHNGIYLDLPYLKKMSANDSPLKHLIDEARDKLYASPVVKEVNDEIAKAQGFKQQQGLFAVEEIPWIFDVGKAAHQQALFIDKLKLRPLSYTEAGSPQIDKTFRAHYENVEECRLFTEVKLREKVFSTNIKGFKVIAEKSPDSRVRCRYGFIGVTTMRSSSTKPNLQNIPNHGPYAKPVKRQFTAPEGRILVSYDLNANEVKNFGNIAQDKAITDAFGVGMRLRRRLLITAYDNPEMYEEIHSTLVPYANGDPEDSADIGKCYTKAPDDVRKQLSRKYPAAMQLIRTLSSEGDIHRMNVQRFQGTPANEVSKTQRQEIKAVVFGSLYGMGPKSLSKTIWDKEWEPHLYLSDEEQKENKTIRKLVNQAKELQASMWKGWPDAAAFVEKTEKAAHDNLVVPTVLGNRRHLWGYLSPYGSIRSQQARQANNSMVQGPSSCINTIAGRIVHTLFYQLKVAGCDLGFFNNNSVHDANYFEGIVVTLPIAMYFITHAATDLTSAYCRKYFGWSMVADPEIDFTAGLIQTEQMHMNWTRPNFKSVIEQITMDEKIIADAMHNFDIINEIRVAEMKSIGDKLGGYCSMSLKPADVPNKGFIIPEIRKD